MTMGNNLNQNYSSLEYTNKLEWKINQIIKQLSHLQHEKDEESLVLMSDLTAQRDRLIEQLQKAQQVKQNEAKSKKDSTGIGSWIKLKEGRKNIQINLVDEYLVDGNVGKISHKSPLGRNLLNKRAGEKIKVETPAGLKEYQILEIK